MALKNTIKEFSVFLGDRESILDRDYARIAGQIELLWGYEEFYRYLERLLVVEKERDRGMVSRSKSFWSSTSYGKSMSVYLPGSVSVYETTSPVGKSSQAKYLATAPSGAVTPWQ